MKKWLYPVRRLVRECGWDLVRYNWRTNVNLRRQLFLKRLGIACVLDIGANVGDYAANLRQFGYQGEIISVEPASEAFRALQARSEHGSRWTAKHVAAAGSAGERTIFIAANSVSSSLLERSPRMARALPGSGYVREEVVGTTTLDALLAEAGSAHRAVWAKLDVQGSAAEILTAANRSYRELRGIEIELPLVEMYGGEGLFIDLVSRLQKDGFELVTLEPNTFDPNSGAVLEVNGTLVRFDAWDAGEGPAEII